LTLLSTSCEEKPELTPEPLSYVSKIRFVRDQIRKEYYGENAALLMEYNFTDIGVNGAPDANNHNLPLRLTPTTTDGNFRTRDYWAWGWDAIRNANSALERVGNMTFSTQAEKTALLSEA